MADHISLDICSTSSPSSGGVDSHHGTPGTKLTEFSPEECHSEQKSGNSGDGKISLPPAFSIQGVPFKISPEVAEVSAFGIQDPFTTSSSVRIMNHVTSAGIKLSPTAADFTPLQSGRVFSISGVKKAAICSTVSYLNATSVPDCETSHLKLTQNILSVPGSAALTQLPIGQWSSSHPAVTCSSTESTPSETTSAVLHSTRYLKISQVLRITAPKQLNAIFMNLASSIPKLIVVTDLQTQGIIYVRFADVRDARKAYSMLEVCQVDWRMQFIGIKQFVSNYRPQDLPCTSEFEGYVKVIAILDNHCRSSNHELATARIKDMLESFGDLISFQALVVSSPSLMLCAEFFDTTAAEEAVWQLNGSKIASITLDVKHYSPDLFMDCDPVTLRHGGPLIIGNEEIGLQNALRNIDIRGARLTSDPALYRPASRFPSPHTRIMHSSLCGDTFTDYRTPPPTAYYSPRFTNSAVQGSCNITPTEYHHQGQNLVSEQAHGVGRIAQERITSSVPNRRIGSTAYQHRGSSKHGLRLSTEYASGHHNIVDIERIRQGLDVRTTIMLRNIPNKIDQAMLKEIVDETSQGKYDFMYLRIDFANNCNVGYAFINFEDPYFITDFVKARAGHRWNRFNSDKVAEVSYATIQGKDCLVQKFRNSSVMLEHPSFRPKIFHTGLDNVAGEEDDFPGPDNPSKMRRSIENAEHVGLFAPRAGQHFRDEQRRRRSQYDRGTRLAEIEDSYGYEGSECRGSFGYPHIRVPHIGTNPGPNYGPRGTQLRGL